MWENGTKRLLWSMVENRYLKKSLGHRRSRLVYYALPDPITLSYNVNLILFYVTHGFNPAFPNSLSAALLKIYCMLSININIKFCRNIFFVNFWTKRIVYCVQQCAAWIGKPGLQSAIWRRTHWRCCHCEALAGTDYPGQGYQLKVKLPPPLSSPPPPTYGRCRTVVGPLCSTRRGARREGCKYGLESKPLNNLEDVK